MQKAIDELNIIADKVTEVGSVEVPWFPTRIEDFDHIGRNVLSADDIGFVDHPAFTDKEYLKRREYISSVALTYKIRDPQIPGIEYTEDEIGVWRYCYPKLRKLLDKNACEESIDII